MKDDYLGKDQMEAINDFKGELIADGYDDQEAEEAVNLALTDLDDDFEIADLRRSLEQLNECGKMIRRRKKLQ